jgi:hypothetical protein
MIFSYRLFPTVPMTAIATPVFKKNFLFELPTDVKQIIKKKEIEVEQENQKIAEKFQELTNADTSDGVDFTYIIDQFKYMSNEEFEDIDYDDELFRIIGAISVGRENEAEFQMLFNSNQIDEEDLEYSIENVKKDDARIKKLVNDYGVFKLLKMHQAEFDKIDVDDYDELELYNKCYYQFLRNKFNSKISYEDIAKMRKFDLQTEYD